MRCRVQLVEVNRLLRLAKGKFKKMAQTNSTSGNGSNYINLRTSPINLIAADERVLYIELREILHLYLTQFESQICCSLHLYRKFS